jgi:hypothetical protein
MSKVITFETLWKNYPSDPPCHDPRTARIPPGYENQCAMRVGYALEKSGVSFRSFRGAHCPGAARDSGLVANAQELANWLRARLFHGCPAPMEYTGVEAFGKIERLTGIIFLADYWQRPTDRGPARTGDHMDLWNGSRMTAFSSWFRVHLRLSWDGLWSDFRLARRVVFWHIR